jgi:methionyl aminopeptidase
MKELGRNDPCWCSSGKKYKKCHLHEDLAKASEGVSKGKRTVVAGVVSKRLSVPEHIGRPEYALSGMPSSQRLSCRKVTPEQIERCRKAGAVAREVLDYVLTAVEPGITTDSLDRLAHEKIIGLGAYPSPLNYMGFPKSICTSVNEVVVHGIPDSRRLEDGDIINCDVTVYVDGMHGDCSETVFVGSVDEEAKKLVRVTWECLLKGIDMVKPGQKLNSIGLAIETHARLNGFSVVREFTGHGIGECFHMAPYVAHYFEEANGTVLQEGMTFTIEPMINVGGSECVIWADNWTAVTKDLTRSAQFEHTVLVTSAGMEILTGGRTPFFLRS